MLKTSEGCQSPLFIPKLANALFRGDSSMIEDLLNPLEPGVLLKTWDITMQIDNPNAVERELILRSIQEQREFGVITVGDVKKFIEGKNTELDDSVIVDVARQLSTLGGKKTFSHTHWDMQTIPLVSGPDIEVLDQLTREWGYECRVVSWLPGNKVFIYREYEGYK